MVPKEEILDNGFPEFILGFLEYTCNLIRLEGLNDAVSSGRVGTVRPPGSGKRVAQIFTFGYL